MRRSTGNGHLREQIRVVPHDKGASSLPLKALPCQQVARALLGAFEFLEEADRKDRRALDRSGDHVVIRTRIVETFGPQGQVWKRSPKQEISVALRANGRKILRLFDLHEPQSTIDEFIRSAKETIRTREEAQAWDLRTQRP